MQYLRSLPHAVAGLFLATSVEAAVMLHTDAVSYAAATGGAASTTFDPLDGPAASVAGNELTFQSGIVSSANTVPDQGNFMTGFEYRGHVDSDGDFQPLSITWELLPNTFGFAFDIRAVNQLIDPPTGRHFETVNLTVDDGFGPQTFLLFPYLPTEDILGTRSGFLGFTSDTPIISVLFSGTGGSGGDIFFIDNLQTAAFAPPAVPLPATFPLAIGALAVLAAVGRRKFGGREAN